MLRNYLLTTLRNLRNNKLFTAVSLVGLSLSIAVCLVITMVIYGQLQQDSYNPNRKEIYRICTKLVKDQSVSKGYATTPLPLATDLAEQFAGLEEVVRIVPGFGNSWVKLEQDVNIPVQGFFADPGFLKIFHYSLLHGNPKHVLDDPFNIVITDKTALKLYDRTDVTGEILKVPGFGDYLITGVLNTRGINSHIKFEALASFSTIQRLEELNIFNDPSNDWTKYTKGYIYVQLSEGFSSDILQENLDFISSSISSNLRKISYKFYLQPLRDINPGAELNHAIGPIMPNFVVYFFVALSLGILFIANFNYVNLAIAKALQRKVEVGIRKINGASKIDIIVQFISESVVIILISFFAAILLVLLWLKPSFERLLYANVLHWDVSFNKASLITSLCVCIVMGIMMGLIPTGILSSINPSNALKGYKMSRTISFKGFRKLLIVIQLSFSIFFILTLFLVQSQFNLLVNHDVGFDKNKILTASIDPEHYSSIKKQLQTYSYIAEVSGTSFLIGAGESFKKSYSINPIDGYTNVEYVKGDEDYVDMLNLQLLAGENFNPEFGFTKQIIINEKAVKKFGFESNKSAIGQYLIDEDSSKVLIIGVVKDFYHQDLLEPIRPLVIYFDNSLLHWVLVKYNHLGAANILEDIIKKHNAVANIDISPYEDRIHQYYSIIFGDVMKIFSFISALAIIITSMGLTGMITYNLQLKLKEITIRKILGASPKSLIKRLSADLIVFFAIGIFIGVLLTKYVNDLWLQDIAVRVQLTWPSVSLALFIVLVLTFGPVIVQIIKATLTNPVVWLKEQ